jgi:hypothetical protein
MYFFKRDGQFSSEVIAFSTKDGVLYFDKFEDNIAGGTLHAFISHISIPEIGIARSSWSYFERELFDTRNNLLGLAEVAFSANDLTLALAARTGLCVHIVVSTSKFHSSRHSTLSSALFACHNVVGIFSSSAMAVRASYLLLN